MMKDIFSIPLDHWYLGVLFLWTYIWRGFALWKSGRLGDKWWFLAMLLVNTAGILEILYIFNFSKHHQSHEHHNS